MHRFIAGQDRAQASLLPASLDDYVDADNTARVVEAFVEGLDLGALGFAVVPAATGRPSYHPAILLKLYIYGYLNRIQSSRRLERECQRNVEVMWLTGRLAPDFKTIADFRRLNGTAICAACAQFVVICRSIGLFTRPLAVIDGSRFKGVNSRDKNFTRGKVALGFDEIEAIADAGYYRGADLIACRDAGITALTPRTDTSNATAGGRFGKEVFAYLPDEDAYRCPAGERLTRRFDREEDGLIMGIYWCTACPTCPMKDRCTTGKQRRVRRWEHEGVVEAMNARMQAIEAMAIRRQTVEHPFGTIKMWMGATHFLCKGLKAVRTEMSLNVLAYNLRRIIATIGWGRLREALAA